MTNTARKPRRKAMGDALTTPDARAEEMACNYAIAPFDKMATEMDRSWGIDRLPELVSPETGAKYGSALAKLNAAISANDPEECAKRAGVCIRGMQAMDKEARAAGHTPMPSGFWMYEQDGNTIIIAQDMRDWPLIEKIHPSIPIFSMREVFNALEAYGQTVVAVKQSFPGAEVKSVSSINRKEMEDDIPPF